MLDQAKEYNGATLLELSLQDLESKIVEVCPNKKHLFKLDLNSVSEILIFIDRVYNEIAQFTKVIEMNLKYLP